ncbi:hypothetical protein L226DRAFT_610684 [Lentinus tigrinus ALCF2SS1-7]|uniref:uncharacterized protein n=1 Tax=Lentinus tigrinus ALCF2SS1-7 TaxID=1328758 RepID=UPI0011660C81|nr:hypothetical protein L226DRAFT_610684 [Lentinus tigrinus ALCF2SS1-7]
MSISERLYIRWLPDEASEPTSTLVLTAPNKQFVDLRLIKPSSPSEPYTTLDWGIGGRSVGTPGHGEWIHDIDSRTEEPEADAGDTFPHPTLPDVSLERGRMRHPESGEIREYEEAWKHIDIDPDPAGELHEGKRVSVFLEMDEEGAEGGRRRGMISRVGQFCQGIVRDGKEVSVQRWARTDGEDWRKVAQIGDATMACEATWKEHLKEGDQVHHDGFVWTVKSVKVW